MSLATPTPSALSSGGACEVCNAVVGELRRGRCWGCYARWVDARPVGVGARCVTCTEKRRRVLKAVELFGSWKPMCFNCAGQLLHLDPLPATITELKKLISRERRANDRRVGKADTRVFQYERRVGERRAGRDELKIEDDMILEITIEDDDGKVLEAKASGSGPQVAPPRLPTNAAAAIAAAPSVSTSDGEVDFESDLTAIRELISELRPDER